MNVQELKGMFTKFKNSSPEHVNQLLDFAKRAYVHNEISFYAYRQLLHELERQGAFTPDLHQFAKSP